MKKKEFESLYQRAKDQLSQLPDKDYRDCGIKCAVIVGSVTATAGMTKERSFSASQLSQIFGLVYMDAKNDPQEAATSGSQGE